MSSDYQLPPGFLLTDYTALKGCSCKIPQAKLLSLLQTAAALSPDTNDDDKSNDSAGGASAAVSAAMRKAIQSCSRPGQGADVGLDCSIEQLRFPAPDGTPLYLISTVDFFFPSIEDPYMQGCIGAANVVSDLCSMGIERPDTVLMSLAASVEMDEAERTHVTVEIIRGFNDTVRRCGSRVTGGQSVYNPWPLIGGTAMAVVPESEFIRPTGLRAGDVLVLTKPLGTQLGVNLRHWSKRPTRLYVEHVKDRMAQAEIDALYALSVACMARLNTVGARMMRKYKSRGGTDVTGFGILGHSRNLALGQEASVRLEIDTLPLLAGAAKADALINGHYKLLKGLSAETSGGLLFGLETRAAAEACVEELAKENGQRAWIVGRVVERKEGEEAATLAPAGELKIIEVDAL
jgi:selenide,water dikinase